MDYKNINYKSLADEIGLDEKHIPLLIGVFLDSSYPLIDSMEIAIKSKDFLTIKNTAHSLKGSSGNLLFDEVYETTKYMEDAATNKDDLFDYKSNFEVIKELIYSIPKP